MNQLYPTLRSPRDLIILLGASQMTTMVSPCPQCNSKAIKKNGYTRHGKQNHRCLDCGKQFSLEPLEPRPDEEVFCAIIDPQSDEFYLRIGL